MFNRLVVSVLVGFTVSVVAGILVVYVAIMQLPPSNVAQMVLGALMENFALAFFIMFASFIAASFVAGFLLRWYAR